MSASHAGELGSIPRRSRLVQLFIHFFPKNQTLRAKIFPFPWEKWENILTNHTHKPKHRFKAVKFMVGHFGWEHFDTLAGVHSVKSYVKSTTFSSIACTDVESFAMSFGCKISSGSGDLSS